MPSYNNFIPNSFKYSAIKIFKRGGWLFGQNIIFDHKGGWGNLRERAGVKNAKDKHCGRQRVIVTKLNGTNMKLV